MNSRTIVTSHPDVACDVCERRLLRGEQHETFLVAGQPRTVCELCAPRAAHQGWKRVSDLDAAAVAVERPRRARGIFDRLRAGARTGWVESERTDASDATLDARTAHDSDLAAEMQEVLGGVEGGEVVQPGPLAQALAIFNATEYPRRIGGVSRSLGAPEVNVRELDVEGVVSILVAWELCWYRYRVDVDAPDSGAELVAQGTELSELEHDERELNASADERGSLHLHAA